MNYKHLVKFNLWIVSSYRNSIDKIHVSKPIFIFKKHLTLNIHLDACNSGSPLIIIHCAGMGTSVSRVKSPSNKYTIG